jgi:hypothetical protein
MKQGLDSPYFLRGYYEVCLKDQIPKKNILRLLS